MKYLSCILLIILIFTFVCVDEAYAGCPEEIPDKETTMKIDTDSYDAFGVLVSTDNETFYFYRESLTHNQPGIDKIVGRSFSGNWSDTWDVYYNDNPELLISNIGGGVINDNIYLFFAMQDSPFTTTDCGYIKSTDLTGTSWSERIIIDTPGLSGRINMNISPLINTENSSLKLIAGSDDTVSLYRIMVLETIDDGLTWGIGSEVYSGEIYMAEPTAAYIGDGKIVALIRHKEGDYVLQCTSDDNGETWSEIVQTNLGEPTGKKIPTLLYDDENGELIVYYHDRYGEGCSKVSHGNAQEIFNDPQAWEDITVIDYDFIYNGYGSLAKLDTEKYLVVYSKEMSGYDADIWWSDNISFTGYSIPYEEPEETVIIRTASPAQSFGGGGGSAYGNKRTTSLLWITSNYFKVCEDVDVLSIDCKFTLKIANQTELKNKFGQKVAAISIEKIDDTYKVKPDGATFNPPATISMECENEHYKIAYFDGEWIKLDSTLENGVISAKISIISSLYSLVFDETEMWGYPYWWWRQFNLPNDEIW